MAYENEFLRSDAMLMEILQERKTITGLLDAVFGFLRRNTDFYHVQKDDGSVAQLGFRKGVRDQIVLSSLQQYDPSHCVKPVPSANFEYTPDVIEEIEVETSENDSMQQVNSEAHFITPLRTLSRPSVPFAAADYKNGAIFENYCWSQTLKDVELQVKLPSELCSAKLLTIDIKSDSITVKSRTQPITVVFAGQLSSKIKHNDAVWTISESKLVISLDKPKEIWWDKLVITESCIDPKKVDCERYIDDLPEEAQITIQKLRVHQLEQDKIQHENRSALNADPEKLARLRKAWDAEGSPFRGQPFDPSMVEFS